MNNAELIKGLRWCADESVCCDDFSGEKCPYFDEKKDSCSVDEILHAAADAIERLTAEVDRKDKALQAWVKTWESRKENAIRHICDHCDTPIDVRLKEGACEDCPIITLVKEIFDDE